MEDWEIYEMRILHLYDHMEEAHAYIQVQQLVIKTMELHTELLEQRIGMTEVLMYTSYVRIDYMYHQLMKLIALLILYIGF